MRVTVRARPGASRSTVGGRYGDHVGGSEPALVVRVTQRAVDGAANAAVLAAVATAFGVRRADVRMVRGERSRTKVLEIDLPEAEAEERLRGLLGG